MKKLIQVALGLVTGIGGFLEIGSVTTAAQAGAAFGFQLIWALLLGMICLIFLLEMSGRFAAVSRHTVVEAMRDRFGFGFFSIVLVGVAVVVFMVLVAEIGGVALSLKIATGAGVPVWTMPVAFFAWFLVWKGNLSLIEDGSAVLGLITVCFAVAVFRLQPDGVEIARGAIPSLPTENKPHYWFIAVSILGASVSPYLLFFYSAGAVEDKWDESYLGINRIIAGVGTAFGALLAVAVLIIAALVLHPDGVSVDKFEQMAQMMATPFPKWGIALFAVSLGITCFGAATELALSISYMFGEGLGWNCSEDPHPAREARFSTAYTVILILATIPLLFGVDPLQITNLSMALTAATLPLAVIPFLILMNDPHYLRDKTNGIISNSVVVVVTLLACVVAIVSIPLQIFGGG